MLGVCSEFERIAKIVIDKAERDTSKRKRKSHDHRASVTSPSALSQSAHTHHTPRPSSSAATPTPSYATQLSPKFNGEQNRANNNHNNNNGGYSPMNTASSTNGAAPRDGPNAWPSAASTPAQTSNNNNGSQEWNPNAMDFGNFSEFTGFGQPIASPPLPGQNGYQPLLPQELWQMSGGLDWDWAEFTGGAYPSFENGKTDDGIS